MHTCDRNISTRFLAGFLTDSESRSYEDHLEVCSRCRLELESEAGSELSWKSARELLTYRVPETSSWVSTGDAISDRSSPDSEWLPECTSSVVLSILSATDDPAFLGRIGTYEISGIVGRGSAGIVLRGFDRALHRNVAIKILDPAIAGVGAARQRFAREARAMAAISHEHVVPVYEVSEHSGLPYFVMEYVPGGSLERRLRSQGPFDLEAVLRIGFQIAQALAAAHASGLVHRDIKPGNILMDRGTERVRVADFGLVRVANDVSCTRSGFIAGTPQYMAPEQVKAEPCDGRSDLFSLGSLLYALCTGHAPFRADTIYAVLQRIVHDSPRSIREFNSSIPAWFDEFVQKLMSKNREDRFASADEVSRILQSELAVLQHPEQAGPRYWMSPQHKSASATSRIGKWSLAAVSLLGLMFLGYGVHGKFEGWNRLGFSQAPVPGLNEQHRKAEISLVAFSVSWNDEEMATALAVGKQIEDELHVSTCSIVIDVWDIQIMNVIQRLELISEDLEEVPAESEPASPEPAFLEGNRDENDETK